MSMLHDVTTAGTKAQGNRPETRAEPAGGGSVRRGRGWWMRPQGVGKPAPASCQAGSEHTPPRLGRNPPSYLCSKLSLHAVDWYPWTRDKVMGTKGLHRKMKQWHLIQPQAYPNTH
ncbi:hypothetical protein NDU88_001195 [Pleurodeles waltl]|uniref:Uncharacterized protein n=1 Tax=Pleurodeles waltl TaxID=8319 RepID=A0AAV7U9F2_PLEWA|nr:hypothetical protein NDU88_001195 [Pleurodeles waltl]